MVRGMHTPAPTPDQALSVDDVATRLGVHRDTVRRLAARGALPPPRKIAGCTRWLESEITSWLREQPVADWARRA
jgi:excisionase family DNA binding protein